MLTAKGLRLGQGVERRGSERPRCRNSGRPARRERAQRGRAGHALDQIEFSIRSRRALESLKVHTLGDLAAKTEAELLACKNFGQTSLNEVRQRLTEYGLKLREPS